MKKNEVKTKVKNEAKKVGKFLYDHRDTIMCIVLFLVIMTPKIVFAADGDADDGAGETQWTFIVDLIVKWGKRVGGAFAFLGGLEFAFGWKDDNPATKAQGVKFFVSGLIGLAVCAGSATFLS